jgi:hypothetical protein
MSISLRLACALVALAAWTGTPVLADTPREIKWKDLVPANETGDPFSRLTREQLVQLGEVAHARDLQQRGDQPDAVALAAAGAAERSLKGAGIDVEGLLTVRKDIAARNRTFARSANAALDGQLVRMPGYVLPLEFSGRAVSEFLLVPWIGACIHTPPPPPNQIVYVRPDKPLRDVRIFAPVWITGRMSIASTTKSLFLIDGESNIDIGYAMASAAVEPYR